MLFAFCALSLNAETISTARRMIWTPGAVGGGLGGNLHRATYGAANHFKGLLSPDGPAQDFKAAFGAGESDTGIAAVDADGVALAAIQGLNRKLEETRAENAELRKRLTELEGFVRGLNKLEDRR